MESWTAQRSSCEHRLGRIRCGRSITTDIVRYSDVEKTILDFICVWQYNSVLPENILMDVSEWSEKASRTKIRRYLTRYPKSVGRMVEGMYK